MNSSAVSFQYDPYGRRAGKTVAGVTTNYLYDGANIAQEISGGSPIANLLSGGIDEVFTRTDSSGTANFLTDALGSTINLTNSSGGSLAQYAYEPFGNTTVTSGSSTNSYEYTGRENDGTGLFYNRNRYYSPVLGRFINQDPLGFLGSGPNLYAYVGDDPIDFSDPFGLERGDWWDPRSYATVGHELNPFNMDGTFYKEATSIWDSAAGTATGDWARVAGAYDNSVLGQTEMYGRSCDKFNKYVGYYGTRGALIGAAVADVAALGLIVAEGAFGLQTRVAIHDAHHTFGALGKLAHIQVNGWIQGVSGSGWVFRIPLPW
jgi:RHS repeat-associated protein